MTRLPTVEELRAKLGGLGVSVPSGPVRIDSYGDSPRLSQALLELIISGKKRAGTSLLWAHQFDEEPIPAAGGIEIVVDHLHEPVLLVRNRRVEIVPFIEVTAEYAAIEGEGDGSLGYWRKAHQAFFDRECGRIGRRSSQVMPVVCCVFEVLNVLPRSRRA